MDPLTALLDGPRARGAFLLRCLLDLPWAIRLEDRSALSVTAVLRGAAWVQADGNEPVRLEQGDLVVRVGEESWTIADGPSPTPWAVIGPGQVCTTSDGRSLTADFRHDVRTWGNAEVGAVELLTGSYAMRSEVGGRLLAALPPLLVVRASELDSPLLTLLADEVARPGPGQEAVLDRLLDLLLVSAVRVALDRPQSPAPGWYVAYSDPVVGKVLGVVQRQPEHPWTVAALARVGGVSRATLAQRFREQVGESPMAFVTQQRLALAADLLASSAATLATVAHQVGYSSPFALSAAFKRQYGVSPRDWRARAG